MSIREQERRQKEAERRIDERMRAADRRVRGGILARQKAADLRANEVIERIEKGGVEPRPLPSPGKTRWPRWNRCRRWSRRRRWRP